VVTGQQLLESGTPDSSSFRNLVTSTHVFARVTPAQKLDIVDVLIRGGEFVAVTGDGVNDTPAMKRAHIGIAMGSGTDAAKETGSLIVVDDNFSSIVAGVEEGRFAYDNVRKVIYLLMSTAAANIVIFLAAISLGWHLPLVAVQLLWLNLITNGIQVTGLAFEGGEPGAMQRPPRKPGERIFNEQMALEVILSGLVMGGIALLAWFWLTVHHQVPVYSARNLVLMLMVLSQNMHTLNCRSETESIFRIPLSRNHLLILGILIAQGIHILCMHIPLMQKVLHLQPVHLKQWLTALMMTFLLIVVMEIFKWIRRKHSLFSKKEV
jgi:magnesium-transporting ATPase (P-type)